MVISPFSLKGKCHHIYYTHRMVTSPFYRRGEVNGDGIVTSPVYPREKSNGMATSTFHLKLKGNGMATSPFYLKWKGNGMATSPFHLNGEGEWCLGWSPLHSI